MRLFLDRELPISFWRGLLKVAGKGYFLFEVFKIIFGSLYIFIGSSLLGSILGHATLLAKQFRFPVELFVGLGNFPQTVLACEVNFLIFAIVSKYHILQFLLCG
jgi:hypothetical protein